MVEDGVMGEIVESILLDSGICVGHNPASNTQKFFTAF
jgi:hypothetical protein